ncbi:MAG: outer membrane protein assembly factor BamB family protein, partial [Planctomycetota bacterium]
CKKQQPHSAQQGTTESVHNQLLTSTVVNTSADFQWPRFHGSQLDNLSRETGLLRQWPSDGPKLLWTAKGIGEGFSTVAIADRLIHTTGNIGKDTIITTLDLDGRLKWTTKNGPAYKREQPGARATPTIDNGRLYHENADGDVVCLDAQTGETIWSINILEKFNGRNTRWGLAEALLIDGNNVICTPGGVNAGIAALDKNTGQTVWICEEISDTPGYCSPIVFEYKGLRQASNRHDDGSVYYWRKCC